LPGNNSDFKSQWQAEGTLFLKSIKSN